MNLHEPTSSLFRMFLVPHSAVLGGYSRPSAQEVTSGSAGDPRPAHRACPAVPLNKVEKPSDHVWPEARPPEPGWPLLDRVWQRPRGDTALSGAVGMPQGPEHKGTERRTKLTLTAPGTLSQLAWAGADLCPLTNRGVPWAPEGRTQAGSGGFLLV